MNKISIVLPLFNEEGNIELIVEKLRTIFEKIPDILFEIIFVDDGSTDHTLEVLMNYSEKSKYISYIRLSRNFGKDNALMAGISYSEADAVITMDGDLQHPPEVISELVYFWRQGFEVVYTYRKDKNPGAGLFNRIRSDLFYKAVNALSDVHMEAGLSDYKLIDRKVMDVILALSEDKPFLRGIIKWVGFRQKALKYVPNERLKGKTKYSLYKLARLATHGLASFSTKPLIFAIYLGFIFSFVSILYIPYVLISLYYHWARSGWASVIVSIAFFSGIQLVIMGIIGLYLGKTFIQVKNRPTYIIQSTSIPFKKPNRKEGQQIIDNDKP